MTVPSRLPGRILKFLSFNRSYPQRNQTSVSVPIQHSPTPQPSTGGHDECTICSASQEKIPTSAPEIVVETLLTKVQKFTVMALAGMLAVVVVLSTAHLGKLMADEIWKPPRFLIPVLGLLELFGCFLPVPIGVELLETLKAHLKKDVIHVRVVLERQAQRQ
jgi:hypothetical protein